MFSLINPGPIKDYYQTLEVQPDAKPEEIKKSFRRLAHAYHPDKNPDNQFAEANFRTIQEAYAILSNPGKRAAYDEERWLSGKINARTIIITPEYLLREIKKLTSHIRSVDVHRMNKQLLQEYLLLFLNDEKIAILRKHAGTTSIDNFVAEIIHAVSFLPYYFAKAVFTRLYLLCQDHEVMLYKIAAADRSMTRQARRQQYLPLLIVLITLLLCFGMYWFSKK